MSDQESTIMIDSKAGIIGLAIGDAMGVPIEFLDRKVLLKNPVTKMLGEQIHFMPKGSWSDDTSLNLALIDSINNKKGIDLYDIGQNFIAWGENGKYTPTGKTFGMGKITLNAIAKLERGDIKPEACGGNTETANGNGSLMRILPIAYYCYSKKCADQEVYNMVKQVSSLTHAHEISIMGCYIYVKFAIELLSGNDIKKAYKRIKKLKYEYFSDDCKNLYSRVIKDNIGELKLADINSSGYVVDTLESTLWILLNTNNYNQAVIGAINLGGDTDTIGACTGGLAGIYYGFENINETWKNELIKYDYIIDLCHKFDDILNNDGVKSQNQTTNQVSERRKRNEAHADMIANKLIEGLRKASEIAQKKQSKKNQINQ